MVTWRTPRRGVALLATMLAIAMMTLLVMDFTTSSALGYRSAANQADELRAYYLARSGINVGLAVLVQSALANPPQNQGGNGTAQPKGYDSLDQVWAQPFPPIPVEGGAVSMSIVDEDRKININQLINFQTGKPNPQWEGIIGNLLSNLNLSPALIPILEDWLDPDSIERDGGAEADFYLHLTPPYEPRNGPIPTIYDLRMLKGVDDQTFLILSRYLTAMPTGTNKSASPQMAHTININTASPEVLLALAPALDIDEGAVKDIVGERELAPFDQATEISKVLGTSTPLSHVLTTTSSYFTITGEGDFAGARKRVYATFKRNSAQGGGASFVLANWHAD